MELKFAKAPEAGIKKNIKISKQINVVTQHQQQLINKALDHMHFIDLLTLYTNLQTR